MRTEDYTCDVCLKGMTGKDAWPWGQSIWCGKEQYDICRECIADFLDLVKVAVNVRAQHRANGCRLHDEKSAKCTCPPGEV